MCCGAAVLRVLTGCSVVLRSGEREGAREVAVAFIAFNRHIGTMSASARPSPGRMPPDTAKTIPVRERMAAARVAALLSSTPANPHRAVAVVDAQGERVEVPAALTAIIHRAAELIAEGHPVAVMSDDEVLSTQDAADLLNVSRQYLVRLVDAGDLPAQKVGSHRRLRLADVLSFRAERDAKRTSTLNRLTAMSEDASGYELNSKSP